MDNPAFAVVSNIKVTFQWSGVHYWAKAQGEHEYLKFPHRHLFKGSAKIQVWGHDRELEFFNVLDYIHEQLPSYQNLEGHSCEWVAQDLLMKLIGKYGEDRCMEVEITEDGENGVILVWDRRV